MSDTWYVDGSGWSGISCAYCIYQSKKYKLIKVLYDIHNAFECEMFALLEALEVCKYNSKIYTDSKQAIKEIRKNECQKEILKEVHKKIRDLVEKKNCQIFWKKRDENLSGKLLEDRLCKLKLYKMLSTNGKRLKWKRRKRY